jgi:hypothetical protein
MVHAGKRINMAKIGDVVITRVGPCIFFHVVTAVEMGIGGKVYGKCKDGYCEEIGKNTDIFEIV